VEEILGVLNLEGSDTTELITPIIKSNSYFCRCLIKMVEKKEKPSHPPSAYCHFSQVRRIKLKVEAGGDKITQK